ncbi:unnamed protein product [Orchesella dallaii]|uniref:Retroviral polymerase SH3-like domain-containing protein n=1 Tax=Orchesella dallaii TaxID=48710 RepID=A0ABP1S806_9HEXA
MLVGYDSNTNSYRLYDGERQCVYIARNVTFEEEAAEYVPVRVYSDTNSDDEEADSENCSANNDSMTDSEAAANQGDSEEEMATTTAAQGNSSDKQKLITVRISANNQEYEARIPEKGKAKVKLTKTKPMILRIRDSMYSPMTLRSGNSIQPPIRFQANLANCHDEPQSYYEAQRKKPPAPASTFMAKAMMCLTILSLFSTASSLTTQNSIPVLRKRSQTPIASGYLQAKLMVKFLNPCTMLNEVNIHADLVDKAIFRCNNMYKENFVTEVENVCPSRQWTEVFLHHRQKRFIPLLIVGGIVLFHVVVAGLSIAPTVMASQNAAAIAELENQMQTQKENMAMMDTQLKIHNEMILDLQRRFNETIANLELQLADFNELKDKSIDSSFFISYITSRLTNGKLILKEAAHIPDPSKHELLIVPQKECKPSTCLPDSSKYFLIQNCVDRHPSDELDFIQVKPNSDAYHIYCHESEIQIEGKTQPCPSYVFTLPLYTKFKINGIDFVSSKVSIEATEAWDPILTLKANWHLQPKVNWNHLLLGDQDLVPPMPELKEELHKSFSFWTLVAGVLILALLAIIVGGLIWRLFKKPTVIVTALPIQEEPINAIENNPPQQ